MSAATLTLAPLRQGERVSREEFERRYETMPDVKAELLDGVVYVTSLPGSRSHGRARFDFAGCIFYYKAMTPGVQGLKNVTTRLPGESEIQPDVQLRILEAHGGCSFIDEDDYVSGSPELVIEVAKSSLDYDRRVKLPLCERVGVRELILYRTEDEAIEWFVLRNGAYEELLPDDEGIIRSETFPGLWLNINALIRGDRAAAIKALQRGVTSEGHARFVAQLDGSSGPQKA